MTLNLSDYLASPKLLVAGVAKALMEESEFMSVLPIENVGALAISVAREGSLPNVSWRLPGSAHGSNKATQPQEKTEQAFSFGNCVDVDIVYTRDTRPRLVDPRSYQTSMTTRAMGREFNDAVINGNPLTTPNRPTGLFYRIQNDLGGNQDIDAGSGSGLDISPDATGLSANIQTFFDKLDKALYACADHKADAILLNDTLLQRYWSIARQSGLLKVDQDNLGREFYAYKGARFSDMGFKIDYDSKIIGDVELVNGTALTGGTATSLYCVRFGREYFTGWEEYELEVKEKGELEDGVTERTIIDWVVGIAVSHPRSITRLHGIIAM